MKRILLELTTGAYRGLRMIVGTDAQLREQLSRADLPDFVPEVQMIDHTAAVNLIKVTPRYILYREMIIPALSAAAKPFHPSQV